MINTLKKQWFVVLIALIFIGFAIFCIYDTNKGKLAGKSISGKDVIASLDKDTNITADDLYTKLYDNYGYGANALTRQFLNAVANESVEMTSDLEDKANKLKAQFQSAAEMYYSSYGYSSSDAYIEAMLLNYGFSADEINEFCITQVKMEKLQNDYIDKNFDTLFDSYFSAKKPRTVSHILIKMEDPDNPTDEEQEKIDAINKALKEGKDFAEVAKEYSDDTSSAENGGYLGLMDTDTSYVESFMKAALKLSSNETSEWVKESNDNYKGWHLIKAGDTTKEELKNNKDIKDTLYTNIANNESNITGTFMWEAAQKLNITYADDNMKQSIMDTLGIKE